MGVEEVSMRMFYTFTESNDWEGETWRFHFPAPESFADATEWAKLRMHLAADEFTSESYRVEDELTTETAVDVLVEHDPNDGYMAGHHKVEGDLDIAAILKLSGEELDRALYKGGVRKFVKRAA